MLEKFYKHLEALQVSPNTIRAYLSDLNKCILLHVISEDLKVVNIDCLLNLGLSPASISRTRASIKKYANFLLATGVIEKIPIELTTTQVPKINKKLPEITDPTSAKEIMDSIDDLELQLIISILSTTGCRISSLVGLDIDDFEPTYIKFRAAKGNKPYISILTIETKELFQKYCAKNSLKNGPLFLINETRATTSAIRMRLKRKLGDKYKNPHSFRHGIATDLLKKGADIYDVKSLLNHSSVTTTETYIHMMPEQSLSRLHKFMLDEQTKSPC